ncbi:MAG: glycosyltransferase, partial [Acidobacteriota bacterium]|nr:glycosyltransferase [Acidobacteriota bacterium]
LVRAGITSLVIAAQGSQIRGHLIPTAVISGQITESVRAAAEKAHRRIIESVLEDRQVDLIHFHGLDFLSYRPHYERIPQLATLHLPVAWYPSDLFRQSNLHLNCVSESQAASHPAAQSLPVVRNGIDVERFRPSARKQEFLLWLGRVCPEKGVHIALRVAHKMNLPLIIAGPIHPFSAHQNYFNQEVFPLLDERRRYIDAISVGEKASLLASARCLLVPSLAAETSSLVAMEAISSGTPVVAFRSGALPEIVEDQVTGFIVDSGDEMADAVLKIDSISPEACRAVASARFAGQRMVDDYIALYERIITAQSVGE